MAFKEYKKESRANWGVDLPEKENITADKIMLGAVLRIADSLEILSKNNPFSELQYYKERYQGLYEQNQKTLRKMRALKGAITRLKRKNK